MKVGDLVKHIGKRTSESLGLIMDFDDEGDPIVEFYVQDMESGAYYTADVEVISESRRFSKNFAVRHPWNHWDGC